MFWLLLKALDRCYGGCIEKVNFPQSLIDDPMRLMPKSEINRYIDLLAKHVNDPLFVAKGGAKLDFKDLPILDELVLNSPVLFTAIVRFNYLANTLESGSKCYTERTSQFTKWCYEVSTPVLYERLFSSVFAVWKYIHVLRHFIGENFTPVTIYLPGTRLGKKGGAEKIFGCPVIWNSKRAEVWFDRDLLPTFSNQIKRSQNNVPTLKLLKYANMPDSSDLSRCVFEVVNYARAYGYPKLDTIAKIMEVSPLTLQRKIQKQSFSFSELVKYQLIYILAPNMLLDGYNIDYIAKELGFNNPQSFVKAFKKSHQITPNQYIEILNDRGAIIG
ncbi:hypothetical protein BSZ04_16650 [Vibrio rotiferianus]|nr:hypothetical protein BSZ04_16650 [Vibrio rotiferianus]